MISSLPAIRAKLKETSITVRGREFYKSIYERIGCKYEVVPERVIWEGEIGWLGRNLKRFARIYPLNEWSLSHIRETKRHTKNYIQLFAEILEVELGDFDFKYLTFEKGESYTVFAPYSVSDFRSYPYAEELYNKLEGTVKVLDQQGRLNGISCATFDEVIACVGNAKHVYSVDTGVLHVALALGVPTTGLFGSTDGEIISSAYTTPIRILNNNGDCPPCYEQSGNFTHRLCKGKYHHAMCMVKPEQI